MERGPVQGGHARERAGVGQGHDRVITPSDENRPGNPTAQCRRAMWMTGVGHADRPVAGRVPRNAPGPGRGSPPHSLVAADAELESELGSTQLEPRVVRAAHGKNGDAARDLLENHFRRKAAGLPSHPVCVCAILMQHRDRGRSSRTLRAWRPRRPGWRRACRCQQGENGGHYQDKKTYCRSPGLWVGGTAVRCHRASMASGIVVCRYVRRLPSGRYQARYRGS